jgi:hypothetical protein
LVILLVTLRACKERPDRSFAAKIRVLPCRHASRANRFKHTAVQDLSKSHPGVRQNPDRAQIGARSGMNTGIRNRLRRLLTKVSAAGSEAIVTS